jgi:hypothetical protein
MALPANTLITTVNGTKFYSKPLPEDVLTEVRALSAWAAAIMSVLQSGSVTSIATMQTALAGLTQTP